MNGPHSARRHDWENLPAHTRSVVETLLGPVRASTPAHAGLNAQLACTLDTPGGRVFAKGLPSGHPNVYRQHNEARIGPGVPHLAPRVLHHRDTGEWNILLFEHVDGRQADLTPGSADLAHIPSLIRELLATKVHDPTTPALAERWARLGDGLDLDLLAGENLVHTDLNPDNIIIGQARTHLVDWSLPGRGAPWLNVAFLAASLIRHGSSPEETERWAHRHFREWKDAEPRAIDTFVEALVRRREEQATTCPRSRKADRDRSAHYARQWRAHRHRDKPPGLRRR